MNRILLAILLLVSQVAHAYYQDSSSSIFFTISGDEATVTAGDPDPNWLWTAAYTGDVVIPEKVTYNGNSYTVTAIDDYAFFYCAQMTSITIPQTVKKIGSWAFSATARLDKITFQGTPQLRTIGAQAFYSSALASITIPKSVTKIDANAFNDCESLKTVTFEANSNLDEIGYAAFYQCLNLPSIELPASLTVLGEWAFGRCLKLTISFQSGAQVSAIDDYAFYNAGITSFTVPKSVQSIGEYAFTNSSLKSLSFESGSELQAIDQYAFYYCVNLTSVKIPKNVEIIDQWAFGRCIALKSLSFESGSKLDEIDYAAFYNCTALQGVAIPASVTYIGPWAFGSAGLNWLSFEQPSNFWAIDSYAFTSTNIDVVKFPDTMEQIGASGFEDCQKLYAVAFGPDILAIGSNTFRYCPLLKTVYIEATTPPDLYPTNSPAVFVGISGATLYVPAEEYISVYAYWSTGTFSTFLVGEAPAWMAVDDITIDANLVEVARYNLQGQRLTAPVPGINIVLFSDGSTKKVLVK